jgi:hypothetical protein
MVAVAWTAIGLLAITVLGMLAIFLYLKKKIDALEAPLLKMESCATTESGSIPD